MKAKDIAEQLLKYPDFDVEFDMRTDVHTYDYPWPEYTTFKVTGIADIGHSSKVIALEVEVV